MARVKGQRKRRAPCMHDVLLLFSCSFRFRGGRGTGAGEVEVLGKATEKAPGVWTHGSLCARFELGVGRSRASLGCRDRFLCTENNRIGSRRRLVLYDGRIGLTSRGIRDGASRGFLFFAGKLRGLASIVTLSVRLCLLLQLESISIPIETWKDLQRSRWVRPRHQILRQSRRELPR